MSLTYFRSWKIAQRVEIKIVDNCINRIEYRLTFTISNCNRVIPPAQNQLTNPKTIPTSFRLGTNTENSILNRDGPNSFPTTVFQNHKLYIQFDSMVGMPAFRARSPQKVETYRSESQTHQSPGYAGRFYNARPNHIRIIRSFEYDAWRDLGYGRTDASVFRIRNGQVRKLRKYLKFSCFNRYRFWNWKLFSSQYHNVG